MPRLRKPNSVIDRIVLMNNTLEAADADAKKGRKFISDKLKTRINAFLEKIKPRVGNKAKFKSRSNKERTEKNTAMSVLKTYVLDTWEVLRRRVYRENLPVDVFAYYKLPLSGNNPTINTEGQWLETAQLIITGEGDAISAGYKPMSNPSVEELSEKLEIARKELKDVKLAETELDEAQKAISDLNPEAESIVDRIVLELEFYIEEADAASKRRMMRNYGVRFETATGEPEEEDTDLSNN